MSASRADRGKRAKNRVTTLRASHSLTQSPARRVHVYVSFFRYPDFCRLNLRFRNNGTARSLLANQRVLLNIGLHW